MAGLLVTMFTVRLGSIDKSLGQEDEMARKMAGQEDLFVSLLNRERSSYVRRSRFLNIMARRHAKTLAKEGTLHHRGFADRLIGNWIFAGETVAFNHSRRAYNAFDQFMDSTPHKKILLDVKYSHIGVATQRAPKDSSKFYWVAVLARK